MYLNKWPRQVVRLTNYLENRMMNTTEKKSVDSILAMLRKRPQNNIQNNKFDPWTWPYDQAREINKHNLKIRMDQFARHLSGESKRYDADTGADLLYYSLAYLLGELHRYNELHQINVVEDDMEYRADSI